MEVARNGERGSPRPPKTSEGGQAEAWWKAWWKAWWNAWWKAGKAGKAWKAWWKLWKAGKGCQACWKVWGKVWKVTKDEESMSVLFTCVCFM